MTENEFDSWFSGAAAWGEYIIDSPKFGIDCAGHPMSEIYRLLRRLTVGEDGGGRG